MILSLPPAAVKTSPPEITNKDRLMLAVADLRARLRLGIPIEHEHLSRLIKIAQVVLNH